MLEPSRTPTGILALAGTRVDGAGSMFDPAVVAAPAARLDVPGATTPAIVERPHDLVAAFRRSASALAAEGSALVVSNCGLSMRFQADVVEAARVPAVMSSLLLVPLLARVFGGGVGVLTYEAGALADPAMRASCGWDDDLDVHVADVRGLESWFALEGPSDVPLPWERMREDLLAVAAGLVAAGGDRVLLLECTAMLPFVDDVRRATALPVFEIGALTSFVRTELDRD